MVGKSIPIVSVDEDAPDFKTWANPAVLGNKVYEELQVTIGMFDMHTIDSQSSFEQSLWALGDAGLGSSRFVVGSGNKEKRVIVLNAESKKRFQMYSLVEYFGLTTVSMLCQAPRPADSCRFRVDFMQIRVDFKSAKSTRIKVCYA